MGVAVAWYYSADDKVNKDPYVSCRATENGEECNTLARVRRFTIGGVECSSVRDLALFPTYLCARHIRRLPALSEKVRPSPASRFVHPVPEVPGYTTVE